MTYFFIVSIIYVFVYPEFWIIRTYFFISSECPDNRGSIISDTLNLKRKVIFEKEKYDFATVQRLSSSCKYSAANKHRTDIALFFSTSVLLFRTVAFGLLIVSAFISVQDLEKLTGIPLIKNGVVLLRILNLAEI